MDVEILIHHLKIFLFVSDKKFVKWIICLDLFGQIYVIVNVSHDWLSLLFDFETQ